MSVDLNDERALLRSDLTKNMVGRLDVSHVLLMNSPPETGKTSLAALVSHALVNRAKLQQRKVLVANLSMMEFSLNETFENGFKRACGIEWSEAVKQGSEGFTVYFVLDEVQLWYNKAGLVTPLRESSPFWNLVEDVLGGKTSNFRVLMFATFSSHPGYSELICPVQIPQDWGLGIEYLNFSSSELQEYVMKWFKGSECLQELEGILYEHGHVGLCTTAIGKLNERYVSRQRCQLAHRSAEEWIRLVEHGSLYEDGDGDLFNALHLRPAIKLVDDLAATELNALRQFVFEGNIDTSAEVVKKFIQVGILVQTHERKVAASSSAMWQYLIKTFIGRVERAQLRTATLKDLVVRVVRTINYAGIRKQLGTALPSDIRLEKTCGMEFGQAAHRCTTNNTSVTCANFGAISESTGSIDFAICFGNASWGVGLLFEADMLDDRISHFGPGNKYSSHELSDFCLVDVRRITSIDSATKVTITQDLRRCEKLFVVCYNAELSRVWLLNGETSWNVL